MDNADLLSAMRMLTLLQPTMEMLRSNDERDKALGRASLLEKAEFIVERANTGDVSDCP